MGGCTISLSQKVWYLLEDRETFIHRYPCKTNHTSICREAFVHRYICKTNHTFVYIDCMQNILYTVTLRMFGAICQRQKAAGQRTERRLYVGTPAKLMLYGTVVCCAIHRMYISHQQSRATHVNSKDQALSINCYQYYYQSTV